MNWQLAIDRNRTALLRIVAMLFAAAGVAPGVTVSTLPRHVHSHVARFLRSAESAARRLIVVVAREVTVAPYTPRPAPAKGHIPRSADAGGRVPAFRLIDPRKRLLHAPPKRLKGPGPRITVFWDESTPLVVRRQLAALHAAAAQRAQPNPPPSPGDPVSAQRLCRRLQSLRSALDDLPRQARRLARLMEKRRHAPPGPGRVGPLRPGLPPGYRKRSIHPVDEVLKDCHGLVQYSETQQFRDAQAAKLKPG